LTVAELKEVQDLQKFVDETVEKLDAIPVIDEKIGAVDKMLKDLGDKVRSMSSRYFAAGEAGKHTLPISKAEFEKGGFKALYESPVREVKLTSTGDLEPPEGPFAAWKRSGDELLLGEAMLRAARKGRSGPGVSAGLPMLYAKHVENFETVKSILKDAMDSATAAPGVGDIIPTGFSPEMERLVQLNLRLLPFIRSFDMPTNPFNFPRQAGRATFSRRSAEETAAFPTARTTGEVSDAVGTTTMVANVPYNAEEINGLLTINEIAEEDSVIALIPFYRSELPNDLARHLEDAFINGDTAGTHQDSDVTAATDHRASWDGLRKFGLANTTTRQDAAGNPLDSNGEWGAQVRAPIAEMGPFGGNLEELVQVVGTRVFNKAFMIPEYRTIYAAGPMATVTGADANRAFRPDGHYLVVSEFGRENLNASGVYDGVTTNLGTSIVFNRNAWMLGRRRTMTIDVFTDSFFKLYGQAGVLLTWRGDIQAVKNPTAASQTHTVITYNSGT